MSAHSDPSTWQWALGLWAAAMTGITGDTYRRLMAIRREYDKRNPISCPIGIGLRNDVERLKRQAPSDSQPCAASEDVKEMKQHITKLFEGQTELLKLVSKMAGKMGVDA